MNFVLKMAWRDSRASRWRLVLVSLSVVLGIAALVGIGSMGDILQRNVELQMKSLLGSDLTVTARKTFSADTLAYFQSVEAERSREISLSSMITFATRGNQRRLVQVRALEPGFPFYGEVMTSPAGAMARLQQGNFAVLEDTLMVQFGVEVGDEVKVGQGTFTVAGALKKIPGESPVASMFSPRVYLSMASLESTALLKRDSFVTHQMHFKLPATTDPELLAKEMRGKVKGERMRFATVEERKREMGQQSKDAFSFISLVGFIALFLGGLGVASAMHVYVRQKIASVAVLRCLGSSVRQSFAIYLTQGFLVGLLGAVLGSALGIGVEYLLALGLRDLTPFQVEVFVAWGTVAKGAVAGLVICLLFTLLPLLTVRRVSPLLAIRSAQGESTQPDPLRGWIFFGIGAAVLGFAILQAGDWKRGVAFALVMGLSFGVLAGLAKLVSWSARRFAPRKPLPYVWRQGLANLHRPNNRTVLLLLSLGLATHLILSLVLTRETLLAKIMGVGGGTRPNLMFFDIQDDQIGPLAKLAQDNGTPLVAQAPVVTMKLSALRGRPAEEILRDEKSGVPAWTLRREYRSTFRGTLTPTEKITSGRFVGKVEPGTARVPVSVEEGLAKDLQLKLGDELTFDVQGVPVTAYVASLREVEWQRMQPNFFVVFPEGVLEPAPKTHLAAVHAASPEQSARLQQSVGRDLPSVSAIDLALILQSLDSIFTKIAWAVSLLASFTVVTGVIVLVGAVLTGRFQRLRETVLLRTLGASRRQLVQIQLVEYGVLGVLAAVTGGLLSLISNGLAAKFIFKTAAVIPPVVLLVAVAASVVVTVVTGLLTNRGIASHPPLEVLRQET